MGSRAEGEKISAFTKFASRCGPDPDWAWGWVLERLDGDGKWCKRRLCRRLCRERLMAFWEVSTPTTFSGVEGKERESWE